jgi:hypothetical protein
VRTSRRVLREARRKAQLLGAVEGWADAKADEAVADAAVTLRALPLLLDCVVDDS